MSTRILASPVSDFAHIPLATGSWWPVRSIIVAGQMFSYLNLTGAVVCFNE